MDEVTLKSVLYGLHIAKRRTPELSVLTMWSDVISSEAEPNSGLGS